MLLIEDDEGDALIVRLLFEETAAEIDLTHVLTLRDAEAIASGFDCALLDLQLPDATGLDGLSRLRAAADDLAIPGAQFRACASVRRCFRSRACSGAIGRPALAAPLALPGIDIDAYRLL